MGFVGLFLLRLFGVGYLYGLEVLLKLLLPLLVILPAVGAYLQFKIIQDAWNVVENHVALRHASVP